LRVVGARSTLTLVTDFLTVMEATIQHFTANLAARVLRRTAHSLNSVIAAEAIDKLQLTAWLAGTLVTRLRAFVNTTVE